MDEDDTTKLEPSGDAPALDRDTAAAASGPASVRTQARAPLLLQPAVGHAGAPTLDDSWADDLPEVRPLSLNAKRWKLGKFSEEVAVVPPTLSGSSSTAASAVTPPATVSVLWLNEMDDELVPREQVYLFLGFSRDDRTLWQRWPMSDTVRWDEHGIFHAATGRWWFSNDPAGDSLFLDESPHTVPAPSTWTRTRSSAQVCSKVKPA